METLVGATKIPFADQILMSDKVRLDPTKPLSAYHLPAFSGHKIKDVFLYNKSHLRINTPLPDAEAPAPLLHPEPQAEKETDANLALEDLSPLMRVMPQYAHQFAWHVKAGLALARQRHQNCSDLVSEMEVQSSAIDNARGSVETHYTYIHTQLSAFMEEYSALQKSHAALLAGFEGEVEALAGVSLHPAVQSGGHTKLIHLVDANKLRAWAQECQACHNNLVQKVSGMEELFRSLRSDVESVFMQAPTVQLEAVAAQVESMSPRMDELASILQALENDNTQIQKLLKPGAMSMAGSATVMDHCQMMETVHESHATNLMPRVQDVRAGYEQLYQRCLDDKNQMTRDVILQLQQISTQQMKIQSMRNKLAVFREAAVKEKDMFAQLQLVRTVPTSYRQCLAECMRRQAFMDVYSEQARQMAERMAKLRAKEQDKRESFRKHVQPFLPASVLAGLGLQQQPPHCQISLPPQHRLQPSIGPADLQRIPTAGPEHQAASAMSLQQSMMGATASSQGRQENIDDSAPGDSHSEAALKMDNIVLRAEVAELWARDCVRRLEQSVTGGPAPTTAGVTAESSSKQTSRGLSQGPDKQPLAASFARKLDEAVSAKQDLIVSLEDSLSKAKQQNQTYETRIAALEKRIAGQATKSSSTDFSMPEARQAKSEPLALTPVLMSPTRSASPATVARLSHSHELLESAISSVSAAQLQERGANQGAEDGERGSQIRSMQSSDQDSGSDSRTSPEDPQHVSDS